MHTVARIFVSFLNALKIVGAFSLMGVLVGIVSNQWELTIFLAVFSTVFFAPIAWRNAWEDFGD